MSQNSSGNLQLTALPATKNVFTAINNNYDCLLSSRQARPREMTKYLLSWGYDGPGKLAPQSIRETVLVHM